MILPGVPNVIVERTYIIVQQPGFDTLGTGSWLGISYAGYVSYRLSGGQWYSFGQDSLWAMGLCGWRKSRGESPFWHSRWISDRLNVRFLWILYGRRGCYLNVAS